MTQKLFFSGGDKKFLLRLVVELKGILPAGGKIAIKLHMGERYNPNHLQPDFVKKVVRAMVSAGFQPFLFDSPSLYEGPRHTAEGYLKQAASLGFSPENIGCPVVVSDDAVRTKGKFMDYDVCKHLSDADGVLVLSHFKGHCCSGMGGAIKNLGMGALSQQSKSDIHNGAKPVLGKGCKLCRKCLDVCPTKCISYGPRGPIFDSGNCYGCSKCIQNCPAGCLKPKVAEFDKLLADGANSAFKSLKNVYFVNVLRRITNRCDCEGQDVRIICPDLGIFMGKDACAIDQASVDTVNNKLGMDIFSEVWNKNPLLHVEEAEKLGMGSRKYQIVEA
jgi:uncharacterized protein